MPYPELKGLLTDIGTEELGHLEMIGAIIHQLTRKLSDTQIKADGFAQYFVDHTTGVYPTAASGFPWSAASMEVKGDPIADLTEDLAAEQKARVTYDNILSSARQVDVIWFNKERFLPSRLFEVEHTTNMTGALDRFYELQDFAARFFIVADAYRKSEFESKVSKSIYKPIKERVAFLEYAQIIKKYEGLTRVNASSW
jgi:spore coat protein JC